jgi:hypothetical protein
MPERVGHALQRCSGCKILHYCGRVCQQSYWKQNKKEYLAIKAGGLIPKFKRAGVRVNNATMLRRGDESSLTPDLDTVYYTKTNIPHIYDVSIAGSVYPMDRIVEHIKSRCVPGGKSTKSTAARQDRYH